MTVLFLIFAALLLAWSNGANDNFKGVASVHGCGLLGYRPALTLTTCATMAGSLVSVLLAATLLKAFTGKGLVPPDIAGAPNFMLAIAIGAGATVLLATFTGFPISTTHALTGAIVGAGLIASSNQVNFGVLGSKFAVPLLVSPVLSVGLGSAFWLAGNRIRRRCGIEKESCVCVGAKEVELPSGAVPDSAPVSAATATIPVPSVTVGTTEQCAEEYAGNLVGISAQKLVNGLHIVSATMVCFARGLNDTPKIAALLVAVQALDVRLGTALVALAMAVGGVVNARRVAETMSHKITTLNHGQGLSANLATSILVIGASRLGVPVSTTHVSVGALAGIGITSGQGRLPVMRNILLSWIITLPCAGLLAALVWVAL